MLCFFSIPVTVSSSSPVLEPQITVPSPSLSWTFSAMFPLCLSPVAMCLASISKGYFQNINIELSLLRHPFKTKSNEYVSSTSSAAFYLIVSRPQNPCWTDFCFQTLLWEMNGTGIEHLDSWGLENIQDKYSRTSDYLRFRQGLPCDPLIDLIQLL